MSFLKRVFGIGETQSPSNRDQPGRDTSESHALATSPAQPPKTTSRPSAPPADDLFKAAENGDAAAIRVLLGKGVDVHAKKRDGKTALMVASFNNYKGDPAKSVRELLAKGADVSAKDNAGQTALELAAYGEGLCDVAQALLDGGADVNTKDNEGRTALMLASSYGNLKLAKLLLANGADANATSKDGTTALIQTSESGRSSELAKLLLVNGADPNAKAIKNGMTPLLMWASFRNTRDVCQALLDEGADVNARDNGGRDALMLATLRGDNELVQALRSGGATGAAQAEAEAKRLKAAAEVAAAAEANAKRLREELAEARRLEAEAVAKGQLLPRPSEVPATEGTFRAAGLMWQMSPPISAMNQDEAAIYAASLSVGGYPWRLPTVHELDALRRAKVSSPTIASYPGMDEGWYWSGSSYYKYPLSRWCVDFLSNAVSANTLDRAIRVRCVVRGPEETEASRITTRVEEAQQTPSEAAVAEGQSEGTFSAAGLTWQREPPWKMDWEWARSYASRLTLAGGGWRLPTLDELEALYEEKRSSPTIAACPGMDEGWYWSAEPSKGNPMSICGVDFKTGRVCVEVQGRYTTGIESVRCVRR